MLRLSFDAAANVWCSIIIVILQLTWGLTDTDTVDHCVVYVLVAFCPAHVKPIMSCSKLISGSQKRSRNP